MAIEQRRAAGDNGVMTAKTEVPPRKSERLARDLLELLRSGRWPVGSRLPSERELARQFKVSRTAVREALRALQLAGEIETRLGEGSFVTGSCHDAEAQDEFVGAGAKIVCCLSTRKALEIAAGILAIREASESDRLKLRAACVELSEAIAAHDYRWYLKVTFNLHEMIARASHNTYLKERTKAVVAPMRADEWVLTASYDADIAAYSLAVHTRMIDALLDGDSTALIEAVCQHYEDYPALRHPELSRLRAGPEATEP